MFSANKLGGSLSKKSLAGSYEIEVVLGSQQVCILEMDLPEANNELQSLDFNSEYGQEIFRGLLAGIFSEQGEEPDLRIAQVYTLLDGISSVRDSISSNESPAALKKYLTSNAKDELVKNCINFFIFILGLIKKDKALQMLVSFSKYLLAKKESLPKLAQPAKTTTPRWDRVAKTDFITDEPTPEIDVNPLEEVVEEAEATETDWPESPEEAEPDDLTDISDIP